MVESPFEALGGPRRDDGRHDEMAFLTMMSESELRHGHLTSAAHLAQQALEREAMLPGEVVVGPHYVWGAVLAARDDLSVAVASLELAAERADALGFACCRLLPRLELALALQAGGDGTRAWQDVHDAAREHRGSPVLEQWVLETEAVLALREGDLDRADVLVDALDEPARSRFEARLQAAAGRYALAAAGLANVPNMSVADRIEHLLLRARAATGDDRDRIVHDAVRVAERDEYVAVFASESSWILPSLVRLETRWPTAYASKLVAHAVAHAGRAAPKPFPRGAHARAVAPRAGGAGLPGDPPVDQRHRT